MLENQWDENSKKIGSGKGLAAALVCACLIGLALCPKPALAAPAVPPGIQSVIDSVQAKPLYGYSTFGLLVADQNTGEVLIEQNADLPFVPGSTIKAFTASAVLAQYGADYRFNTPVFARGKLRQGKLNGNLVLVGSGDFSLGMRDLAKGGMGYNSTPEVDHNYGDIGVPGPAILPGSKPLRGINALAKQVRASGIRRVAGDVVIDDRLFKTFTDWPDGKISPVWLNENVIDAEARPSAIGKPAKLDWRPKTPMYRVVNRTRTTKAGSPSTLTLSEPKNGKLILSGNLPADSGSVLNISQVTNPAAFMRSAFIAALKRQGVKVSAKTLGPNPRKLLPGKRVMTSGKRVAVYRSQPLSEFTKVVLKLSYNRGADLLACLLAVKRGSDDCFEGLTSILENDAKLGLPDKSVLPFDGAGSDDADRITPRAAIGLLSGVLGQPYGGAFYDALPILGVDGTFRETGLNSPAKGKVRAKSGTRIAFVDDSTGLVGVEARIGYMEAKSGRKLIFADLIRDTPISSMDEVKVMGTDMTVVETAIQQGY